MTDKNVFNEGFDVPRRFVVRFSHTIAILQSFHNDDLISTWGHLDERVHSLLNIFEGLRSSVSVVDVPNDYFLVAVHEHSDDISVSDFLEPSLSWFL